jgi:hypothetical protein
LPANVTYGSKLAGPKEIAIKLSLGDAPLVAISKHLNVTGHPLPGGQGKARAPWAMEVGLAPNLLNV